MLGDREPKRFTRNVLVIPALKCWAIISRPAVAVLNSGLFCAKPNSLRIGKLKLNYGKLRLGCFLAICYIQAATARRK